MSDLTNPSSTTMPNLHATVSQLHTDALKLFKDMAPGKRLVGAKRMVANYNIRRKEQTAALKPILAEMDGRFKAGEEIGGCGSMKEWCGHYKNWGVFTYALRAYMPGVH